MPEAFGLYIHWPFCQAKCPYCDFNSHVARHIDQKRWLAAYVAEIARVGALTSGRTLTSVFFGGGTPSLMDPETVDGIMAAVRATWPLSNTIEVTLEANPTSIEAGRFHGYQQAGVNRISIGIQALNGDDLQALGRLHSVAEGLAAFETARGIFDRVSFDLIYARQKQGVADWRAELERALALGLDHLSLYQLTIEEGTAFGDRYAIGKLHGLPDEDLGADLYEVTQEVCDMAGLNAYEVSNHAKNGLESAHNLTYWRYQDYAGVGPGAHGRLTLDGTKYATETELVPGKWLELVETAGSGENLRSGLSAEGEFAERLLMGLRLKEGVLLGPVPDQYLKTLFNNINDLERMGFIEYQDDLLRVTPNGRPVLNGVLRTLLTD